MCVPPHIQPLFVFVHVPPNLFPLPMSTSQSGPPRTAGGGGGGGAGRGRGGGDCRGLFLLERRTGREGGGCLQSSLTAPGASSSSAMAQNDIRHLLFYLNHSQLLGKA